MFVFTCREEDNKAKGKKKSEENKVVRAIRGRGRDRVSAEREEGALVGGCYMKEQDIPEYLEGCGLTTCASTENPEITEAHQEMLRDVKEKEPPKEKKLSTASISSETKKTVTVKLSDNQKLKPTAKKSKPIRADLDVAKEFIRYTPTLPYKISHHYLQLYI